MSPGRHETLPFADPVTRHPLIRKGPELLVSGSDGSSYHLEKGVWRMAPGFRPGRFSAERRAHLEEIEKDHFWFGPRDRLAAYLVDKEKPPEGYQTALELGCGTGRFLPLLMKRAQIVAGADGHPESLERAVSVNSGTVVVHADLTSLPFADATFDLIVALDVLEHMDPAGFLTEARRTLRGTGVMVLSVPADPRLWSAVDEVAGHRCRYTREQLEAELARTGWRLQHYTRYQFLVYPLIAAARLWNRNREGRLERHPPRLVNRALGAVNAAEVSLFKGLQLPWGSSLLAVARPVS